MVALVAALPALTAAGGATAAAGGASLVAAAGAPAVAAATASVGAAAAGTAASSIGLGSILSGTLGAASAVASIFQGFQAASAAADEAAQVKVQIAEEQRAGAERARQTAQEFRQITGQALALAGASGVDLGSASIREVSERDIGEKDRRISINRDTVASRVLALRERKRGLLASRLGSIVGGIGGAATSLLSTAEAF